MFGSMTSLLAKPVEISLPGPLQDIIYFLGGHMATSMISRVGLGLLMISSCARAMVRICVIDGSLEQSFECTIS